VRLRTCSQWVKQCVERALIAEHHQGGALGALVLCGGADAHDEGEAIGADLGVKSSSIVRRVLAGLAAFSGLTAAAPGGGGFVASATLVCGYSRWTPLEPDRGKMPIFGRCSPHTYESLTVMSSPALCELP
jgi:hypothetical protein